MPTPLFNVLYCVITAAGAGLLVWQLIMVKTQLSMLQKQLRRTMLTDGYGKWMQIGMATLEHPRLSLMEFGAEHYEELRQLSDEELRQRIYSVVFFNQLSSIFKQVEGEEEYPFFMEYVRQVASNPMMQKCWTAFHVGETFADPFHSIVDGAMRVSVHSCRPEGAPQGQ